MKFFNKDELKLLWPFYFDSLIISMLFIIPAFSLLYFREMGFSLTQIGFLDSSFALAMFLFEIPTGALADVYGRKFSVILGAFLSGIIVFSISFFHDFYLILVLFFLWGVFSTLMSGAEDAWVVDLLKHKKRKNLIHEFYTKRYSFISIALLVSGIVGALLVKNFGLRIIWPVTGVAMILASITLIFGKEYFIKKKQNIKKNLKDLIFHTKKSIKFSLTHQSILFLMIISFIMAFVYIFAGEISWYPFLQDLGLQEYWFGYLFSATMFAGIFIPYSSKFLIKKFKGHRNYLVIILFFMAFFLILAGFINILILVLIILWFFMAMQDFYDPVKQIYFQKFLSSKMRATIGSFKGMIISLGAIIAAPLAGFTVDKIGPQNTILMSPIILIPVIVLYFMIKDK